MAQAQNSTGHNPCKALTSMRRSVLNFTTYNIKKRLIIDIYFSH